MAVECAERIVEHDVTAYGHDLDAEGRRIRKLEEQVAELMKIKDENASSVDKFGSAPSPDLVMKQKETEQVQSESFEIEAIKTATPQKKSLIARLKMCKQILFGD